VLKCAWPKWGKKRNGVKRGGEQGKGRHKRSIGGETCEKLGIEHQTSQGRSFSDTIGKPKKDTKRKRVQRSQPQSKTPAKKKERGQPGHHHWPLTGGKSPLPVRVCRLRGTKWGKSKRKLVTKKEGAVDRPKRKAKRVFSIRIEIFFKEKNLGSAWRAGRY